MTTQYDLEDAVVSADDMVSNFTSEAGKVADLPAIIATSVNDTLEYLRQLKEDYKAAGNKEGVSIINQAGRRILDISRQSIQQSIALDNAREVIEFINDERLNVVAKLDDLETALAENDSTHPALEDYASYMREEGFGDAYEAALGESEKTVFDDIMRRVQHLTACSSYQAYCVTRILNDSRDPQPEQVELLTQLANTFQGKS